MVVFTACIGFPQFGEIIYLNPLNIWFNETIQGLYQAPILKTIFGFFGFFFMVSTFQKGISSIKIIIDKISGKSTEKSSENPMEEMMKKFTEKNSRKNSSEKVEMDDDLYVDFEEMEDNEN
jgi:amino acid permease